jgi:probable rRNA maturation factor
MKDEYFNLTNTTKSTLPRVSFDVIKKGVLGEKYSLSLVFVGDARSKMLNKSYRGIDKPTNILSFPYSKNDGEIFINLRKVRQETGKFNRKFDNLVAYLFIHGLLHLKGMEHSSTMEKAEEKLCKKFGV